MCVLAARFTGLFFLHPVSVSGILLPALQSLQVTLAGFRDPLNTVPMTSGSFAVTSFLVSWNYLPQGKGLQMFNVSELIEQVRDSVHEYDSSPMSDDKIVRRLNRAYSFAYNYLVKMNHSLFSGFKYITVKTDIGEYRIATGHLFRGVNHQPSHIIKQRNPSPGHFTGHRLERNCLLVRLHRLLEFSNALSLCP